MLASYRHIIGYLVDKYRNTDIGYILKHQHKLTERVLILKNYWRHILYIENIENINDEAYSIASISVFYKNICPFILSWSYHAEQYSKFFLMLGCLNNTRVMNV